MKKLDLKQYGVQEMEVMESKEIEGGISPYQNGTMIDRDGTQEFVDVVVSFFEGFFHGLSKN